MTLTRIVRTDPRRSRRRGLLASSIAVISISLGAVLPAPVAAQRTRAAIPVASAGALSRSLEEVVDSVRGSVVQITASTYVTGDPNDPAPRRELSSGSGVVIDPTGFIATNAHVVAGARDLAVLLPLRDGSSSRFTARLVGADRETDIALLKIDTTGLRPLPFADSARARPGMLVLAFGAPLALPGSVTMGIVSAVDREIDPASPIGYIQTDAPINPGNSGGPLVDPDGKLLGMNTMILSRSGGSEGIGLAIPAAVVRRVVTQLRTAGRVRRGVIGVRVQQVTQPVMEFFALSRPQGLLVSDIAPQSPADSAGLQIGDVLTAVDGVPISSVRRFSTGLYRHQPRAAVTLTVFRDGTSFERTVVLADAPDDPSAIGLSVDPDANRVDGLGVIAATLDSATAMRIPQLRYGPGVLVAAIAEPADELTARFETGDIIHSVNGRTVFTLEALREELRRHAAGIALLVWVERDGHGVFIATRRGGS